MIDVHPILVHFPIALLTCYALAEIFLTHVERWQSFVTPSKISFLLLGTLASWGAFLSGDIVAEAIGETPLIETHAFFAGTTIWIFTILSATYTLRLAHPFLQKKATKTPLLRPLLKLDVLTHLILRPWFLTLFCLAGLIAITITGALGGAIVYGPEIDPIVSLIYHLFF